MTETLPRSLDEQDSENDSYETFLECARNGDLNEIEKIVNSQNFNHNYRGKVFYALIYDAFVIIPFRKKEAVLWLGRFAHCLLL